MSDESQLAVLEETVKILRKELETVQNRHEEYRTNVHDRFGNIHTLYNTSRDQIMSELTKQIRRIDNLEHSIGAIDKIVQKVVDEFKAFGSEVTAAISKLEKAVEKANTRRAATQEIAIFVLKLTGFAATVIGIIEYITRV